ncbi:MAG: MarR family transcriptional regulator [Brevefilum sp.]|nr:MarR family transcriptional regulator [Brevefilum sp.]MDT8382661.1 MarR family transcriptional regulator [Brevefilum sp.]MDW7754557.1 MarR family transcriptional regulator [Brevefilum sp.]
MSSPANYQTVYQSIKSISLHLDNGEKSLFSRFGLTTSRFFVLKHLNDHPGINYIDLSEKLLCTKGNTTRIVQGMLNDDLIYRWENPKDRRSFQLYLSKLGKQVYKEVNLEYQDYVTEILSKLNEDQLEVFRKISSSIEKELLSACKS